MFKPWVPANLSSAACSQAVAKQASTTHYISCAVRLGGSFAKYCSHLPISYIVYRVSDHRFCMPVLRADSFNAVTNAMPLRCLQEV